MGLRSIYKESSFEGNSTYRVVGKIMNDLCMDNANIKTGFIEIKDY